MVKKQWIQGHLNDVIDSLVAGVSVNSGEQDGSSNFFVLKTSAISKGKLNLSEKKPVLSREVARLKCSLRQETILISRMNTPELVGECAYVACDNPQIYLPDRIWQTNFKKDVDISVKWLNYLLGSKKYRSLIQNCATGTSNSMKNISKEKLLGLEILYPSFREQTSIAEALSDVDSLISSLQKLIEKKKAIKQGAMQELLTGKKRLPGFSGEWEKYKVREIGVVVTGSTPPRSNRNLWGGNFSWVSARDFIGKYISFSYEHVTSEGKNYCRILPAGSVLVTCIASIGLNGIAAIPLATNQQINAIICNNDFYNEIVYYSLVYNKEKLKLMAGQTAVPIISKQQFEAFEIFLPRNVLEQKAIAKVLSDMDSEIEQLENKLAKYQQIKQGMMQELLTGRIRLVDVESNEQSKTQVVQKKQPQPKAHNQHFDDAVMIAGIVNAFYSEKYPLGRKKVQKLLYLVRRKEQADISAFHKKAAGPYADEVRYKGGEPIAQKNKYIQVKRNEKGSCFEKGVQMQQALAYLQDWGKQADIDWLVSQFQYTNVNELELLATVDMAICDLHRDGKRISVASIKDLIHSNKEWRDKLKKAYFKDADIQRAIKKCQDLFES